MLKLGKNVKFNNRKSRLSKLEDEFAYRLAEILVKQARKKENNKTKTKIL